MYKDKVTTFQKALDFILSPLQEGGYANDSNDLGGETYCGIARNFHPSWEGWAIIDDAKEAHPYYRKEMFRFNDYIDEKGIALKVQSFYMENFWKPLRLEKVVNENIAIKIFDMSVNLGVARGSNMVQTCLNLMNYKDNYELKVDNIIGDVTANLINLKTEKDNGEFLLNLLTLSQGNFFMKSAQSNPNQKKYIKGWIKSLNIKVTV